MKTHTLNILDSENNDKSVTFEYYSEFIPKYPGARYENDENFVVDIQTPLTVREDFQAKELIMEFLGVKDSEEITFE